MYRRTSLADVGRRFFPARGMRMSIALVAALSLAGTGCQNKSSAPSPSVAGVPDGTRPRHAEPADPGQGRPASTDNAVKAKDQDWHAPEPERAAPVPPTDTSATKPTTVPAADDEAGVDRHWKDAKGKTLIHGAFAGSDGDAVQFKESESGRTVSHRLSELSPGDVQYLKHWADPARRAALRKFGDHVGCDAEGNIGLMLSQTGTTDNDLRLIASLPQVVSIDLYQCRITDEGLKALTALKSLKFLHVEENDIKGPGFKHVAALTSLEDFAYSPERGGSARIAEHTPHLANLKNLKALTLRFCTVGADGLKPIGRLANLQSLDLMEAEVDSPALEPLRGLTKLKRLDLSGNRVDDTDMAHVGALQELRSLDVGSARFTGEGLKHVAKLDKLERLDLPGSVTDGDLRHLAGLTSLKWLRLGQRVTDDGLRHLGSLQNLEELHLPAKVTNAGLDHLAPLKRLKRLEFEGDGVTFSQAMRLLVDQQKRPVADALAVLLWHLEGKGEKVTHLSLDFRPRADAEALKYLAHLPDLEGLSLGKEATDEWLKSVGQVKKLRSIQFRGDRFNNRPVRLTLAGLKELAGCQGLEAVEFHDCEIGPGGLSGLVPLPKLARLSFSDCKLADGNAAAWAKMPALEHLWLSETNVSDADLRHLAGSPRLKHLTVPGGVTLKGLAQLKGVKSLASVQANWAAVKFADVYRLFAEEFGREPAEALGLFLSLGRSPDGKVTRLGWAYELKATAEDLKVLQKLPDLVSLTLPPDVTDDGLKAISSLTKLRDLSFASERVTDDGLRHLAGLTELESLSIHQAPVTDRGLKHLAGLRKLTSVDLTGSKVTDEGVRELQAALPKASIRK